MREAEALLLPRALGITVQVYSVLPLVNAGVGAVRLIPFLLHKLLFWKGLTKFQFTKTGWGDADFFSVSRRAGCLAVSNVCKSQDPQVTR